MNHGTNHSTPVLFDANCMIGRRSSGIQPPLTSEELLVEMDRLGIGEALVCHYHAIDAHPADGNKRLLKEIEKNARLHPCWVLLPDAGELPPPADLVTQMLAHGVRAARLIPNRHHYVLSEVNCGGLLSALEQAQIPLFVDFEILHWAEPKTDWRMLDELCSRYPRLPFIVVGESLMTPRKLFPFWHRHENLYLETSYYQVHQGLSEIVRRFGPHRMLLGTGFPRRAAGPALAQLQFEQLTEDERAAIGGNNLRRLLDRAFNSRQPTTHANLVSNTTTAKQGGSPTPRQAITLPSHPIIDLHAHLGRWDSTYINAGNAENMIQSMDRMGIQAMALIAFDAIGPDMCGGNDQVFEAMQRFPGRFLGYATVDPHQSSTITSELERCIEQRGFRGIKFHCDTHRHPADGPGYVPALEYANHHGLCILIHGRITEAMLRTYPHVQFLSAHAGGSWDGRFPNESLQLALQYSNIHLDLASTAVYHGGLEALAAKIGAERIVHGSDCPLMDPGYQLGRVFGSRLTSAEKELILFRNAVRLFHLPEIKTDPLTPISNEKPSS